MNQIMIKIIFIYILLNILKLYSNSTINNINQSLELVKELNSDELWILF